jgi:hypothetical protein
MMTVGSGGMVCQPTGGVFDRRAGARKFTLMSLGDAVLATGLSGFP